MTSHERKAYERKYGTNNTRSDRDGKSKIKYGRTTMLAMFNLKEALEDLNEIDADDLRSIVRGGR